MDESTFDEFREENVTGSAEAAKQEADVQRLRRRQRIQVERVRDQMQAHEEALAVNASYNEAFTKLQERYRRRESEVARRKIIEDFQKGEYLPTGKPLHPQDAQNLLTVFQKFPDGRKKFTQSSEMPMGSSIAMRDLGISLTPYFTQMMRQNGFPAEPNSKIGKRIKEKFDNGLREEVREKICDALYTFKSTEHDEAIKEAQEGDPSRPGLHERVINRATAAVMGHIQEIALDMPEINAMLTSDDPQDRKWAICEIMDIYSEAATEYRTRMIERVEGYTPEQLNALGMYHARMAKDLGEMTEKSIMGIVSSPEQIFGLMLLGPALGSIILAPVMVAMAATAYQAVRRDNISKKKGFHLASSAEIMAEISAPITFGETMLFECLGRVATGENRLDIITKSMPEAIKRNAAMFMETRNKITEMYKKYGADKKIVVGSPEWANVSQMLGDLAINLATPAQEVFRIIDDISHSLYRDMAFLLSDKEISIPTYDNREEVYKVPVAIVDPGIKASGKLTQGDIEILQRTMGRYNETMEEFTEALNKQSVKDILTILPSESSKRGKLLSYVLMNTSGSRYYCSEQGMLGSNASTGPALINGIIGHLLGDSDFWINYDMDSGSKDKVQEEWFRKNMFILEDLRTRLYPPDSWTNVQTAKEMIKSLDPVGSQTYTNDWEGKANLLSLALVAGMRKQVFGQAAVLGRNEFGIDNFSDALLVGDVLKKMRDVFTQGGEDPGTIWNNDEKTPVWNRLIETPAWKHLAKDPQNEQVMRQLYCDALATLRAQFFNPNAAWTKEEGGAPISLSRTMEKTLHNIWVEMGETDADWPEGGLKQCEEWLCGSFPTEGKNELEAYENWLRSVFDPLHYKGPGENKVPKFLREYLEPKNNQNNQQEQRTMLDIFEKGCNDRLVEAINDAGKDFEKRSLTETSLTTLCNLTSDKKWTMENINLFVNTTKSYMQEAMPEQVLPLDGGFDKMSKQKEPVSMERKKRPSTEEKFLDEGPIR